MAGTRPVAMGVTKRDEAENLDNLSFWHLVGVLLLILPLFHTHSPSIVVLLPQLSFWLFLPLSPLFLPSLRHLIRMDTFIRLIINVPEVL
jgi:hypothetical protein